MAVRGSSQWREDHYGPPCQNTRRTVTVAGWAISVDARTAEAWIALGDCFGRHGYAIRSHAGTFNCRKIANSNSWSSHAWAIAWDVNVPQNPQGNPLRTDMPTALITDIEAIRTVSGQQVFRWGGRYATPDPMHFELYATPAELATGIIDPNGGDMPLSADDLAHIRDMVRAELGHPPAPSMSADVHGAVDFWANNALIPANNKLNDLLDAARRLENAVANLTAGPVDCEVLANKVADVLAARLQS